MTPKNLDTATVQAKLRLIRELLDDLDSAGEITGDRLRQDRLLRHAVERMLTQVVDLAVSANSHVVAARLGRAPNSYRQSFLDAAEAGSLPQELAERLAPAVGMRNLLVHDYATIDLDRVAAAVPAALVDVSEYVHALARWLADQG